MANAKQATLEIYLISKKRSSPLEAGILHVEVLAFTFAGSFNSPAELALNSCEVISHSKVRKPSI